MGAAFRNLVIWLNFLAGVTLIMAAAFQLYDLAIGLPYPDPAALLPAKALLPFSCMALYTFYKTADLINQHKPTSGDLAIFLNIAAALIGFFIGGEAIKNWGKHILNPFEAQALFIAATAVINIISLNVFRK